MLPAGIGSDRPLKVLFCIPNMAGGGAERQLTYLAAELVKRLTQVHVVLSGRGPNFERLQASGAIIHPLHSPSNYSPAILWRLRTICRQLRPDLIQTWFRQMDILGGCLARAHRIPWILSERSSALHYPGGWKYRIRARLAAGTQAIVSNSPEGDAYWQPRVKRNILRFIIPNGLPLEEISAARPEEELRQRPDQKIVLFVGRFTPEKCLETVLVCLQRVVRKLPVRLVICGSEGEAGPAQRRVEALGLGPHVCLAGYVSRIWSYMKGSDVLVSTSLFEGQPNAVMEAMACGCPLIVSDIPAHRAILDEQTAAFAPVKDPVSLADLLTNLLLEPAPARQRAERARQRAATWSVEKMGEQYLDAYRTVLRAVAG